MRCGKPAAEPVRGTGQTGGVWGVQGAKRGTRRVTGAARCEGAAVPAATVPVSPGIFEAGRSQRVRVEISRVDPVPVLRMDSSPSVGGAFCSDLVTFLRGSVCVWLKSLGRRT